MLFSCFFLNLDFDDIMFFFGHTQNDQHTEWIHRGSLRLEHMARFLKKKEVEEDEDDSD